MSNVKATTVKLLAADKLTRILLDAVLKFRNFWNALNKRELPKMTAIITIAWVMISIVFILSRNPSVRPLGAQVKFFIRVLSIVYSLFNNEIFIVYGPSE